MTIEPGRFEHEVVALLPELYAAALRLAAFGGKGSAGLIRILLLTVTLVSSFFSNTITTAVFLPIAIGASRRASMSISKVLCVWIERRPPWGVRGAPWGGCRWLGAGPEAGRSGSQGRAAGRLMID